MICDCKRSPKIDKELERIGDKICGKKIKLNFQLPDGQDWCVCTREPNHKGKCS